MRLLSVFNGMGDGRGVRAELMVELVGLGSRGVQVGEMVELDHHGVQVMGRMGVMGRRGMMEQMGMRGTLGSTSNSRDRSSS
jgi:hypothetical protein